MFGLLLGLTLLAQPPDFTKDVQPVLAARCVACHGPAQQMSGLRLDFAASVLAGGNNGPAVVVGNAAASKLIERVTSDRKGFQMPPMGARLSAKEIATLRAWIDAGAKIPSEVSKSVERSTHWAFQAIRRPAVPVNEANPIDAFVRERLAREKLTPSPQASRATLLRRVSLDLTGLPPTPAEVSAFLNDSRPDAFERQVDRLLASPHFGEKWARHWLDLAHYADSDGYEKDQVRPHAWRYRQWVIEALNRDMPFDRFTIEQLAGDLLPQPATEQRVATGFLRNTLTNREAGVDRMETRFEQLVNRTNTVATTWLALTAGCAQCHNHKYDPIKQKDYYSLMAYFENAEEQDIDAPVGGQAEAYQRALPEYRARRQAILDENQIGPVFETWQQKIRKAFAHQGDELEWDFAVTSFRAMFDGAEKFLKGGADKLDARQREHLTDYFLGDPGPDIGNRDKATGAKLKKVREQLNQLRQTLPPYAIAPAITAAADGQPSFIHIGGDYKTTGEAVSPATPAFLPGSGAGTRLDLARWLVAPENPLTARVAVNRIWQELFGRGLVSTSEDFGTQGDRPSHPELLDWLASDFRENGWSTKQIIRKIVVSATYRQSSNVRPELQERDPENILLARQSRIRLPAELIRDGALSAGGLLNSEIGGASVRPPQPAGVAELGYGGNVKWKDDSGPARYRRGLYIHYQRTTPYPMLANFDEPDSTVACSRRRRSNSPLQALNLLNDPVFFDAADALAKKQNIDEMFQLALGRPPSGAERVRLGALYEQTRNWTAVARVLLNLEEFITRE